MNIKQFVIFPTEFRNMQHRLSLSRWNHFRIFTGNYKNHHIEQQSCTILVSPVMLIELLGLYKDRFCCTITRGLFLSSNTFSLKKAFYENKNPFFSQHDKLIGENYNFLPVWCMIINDLIVMVQRKPQTTVSWTLWTKCLFFSFYYRDITAMVQSIHYNIPKCLAKGSLIVKLWQNCTTLDIDILLYDVKTVFPLLA